MEGTSNSRANMQKLRSPPSNSTSKPRNNLDIPIFNASQMASPPSYMRLSSENNCNKRSRIPPPHPNNPTVSLPCPPRIIGYSPSSQQGSLSHSRSLSQPTFFSPWTSPPYLDPCVSSLPDPAYNGVSMEKTVVNSNIRPSLPSPVGRGSNLFCVGDSSSLPPRRGHMRSSSDFPLGSSAMIQSWPQTNSIGNPGVEEPIQLMRRGLADDLFNAYMSLENIETLNSSGTEDKDLDSRGSGKKTYGGESSDNEVESSVNGHPINMHGHGTSFGVSVEKKEPTLFKGSLQFYDESRKRNRGVRRSTGSSKFNEAELKKIMENDNLAEIASVDPKRAKRILANRQSAARSKERKILYIAELEHKLQTLQMEATTVSAQLTMLQRDSFGLTSQNNELKFRLQAMEKQAQLKDALNEALAAEVRRLELAAAELGGEAHLSSSKAQQLSINHTRSQSLSQQLDVPQTQQHQHRKQQQRLQNQQQNGEPTGKESK
ncbi:hypothetical protein V6N13_143163 [Hibiscus sabdariffa]|uniref:BZIP domain-containing protein n=1 Tax=Hibiscus sabdariffa TaxID=183260 RepID=A0ABR2FGG9_9ROSI